MDEETQSSVGSSQPSSSSSSSPVKLQSQSVTMSSMRGIAKVLSPVTTSGRAVRRVVQIDSDTASSEFDTSSDEEVLEVNPAQDDYVEIPRAKGELPPETMELSLMNNERLVQFKNLYLNQPKHIKELMKIYFYKGDPVVKPPPLASLIQKVKAHKTHKKMERAKKLRELEEKYSAAFRSKESGDFGSKVTLKGKGKKKAKEAKVNVVEIHETDSQLVHVDFPARVVNPEKAIHMMGGYNTVNKVFNNVKKKLPVRFRPDDPFCNAAMADPYPTVGLLLRVRRRKLLSKPKRPRNRLEDEEALLVDLEREPESSMDSVFVNGVRMTKEDILREDKELLKKSVKDVDFYMKQFCGKENPEQYYVKIPTDYKPKVDKAVKIEALGIISRTYKFSGICDFQYLPMQKENGKMVSKRNCVLPLVGTPGENIDDMFAADRVFSEEGGIDRFLVPPMMSRVDKPLEAVIDHFMDADHLKLAPELEKQRAEDVISTHRSKRNVYTMFHNFQAENSSAPVPQEPLPEALEDLSKRRMHGAALSKLQSCFNVRPIWSRIALEFETQLDEMTLKYALPCVAYFANNGPWRTLWIRLGYDPRLDQSSFLYQTVDYRVPFIYKQYIEEKDKSDDHSFRFRPNGIPPRAQAFYQICDIKVNELERLIEIASKKVGKDLVYDHKFGWLKEGTFEYVRQILNQYIELYLEELGKIPEQTSPIKVWLKDGELEPSEKLSYKRRVVKRFRKSKQKPPSSGTISVEPSKSAPSTPGSSKNSRSKKKVSSNSKVPTTPTAISHGTLQDLSIKDMNREKDKELQDDEDNEEDEEDFDFLFDDVLDDDDEGSGDDDDDDDGGGSDEEEEDEKEAEIEQKLKQEINLDVGDKGEGDQEEAC